MIYGSREARRKYSALEIGREFVGSAIRALKDSTKATDEEQARRLNICQGCDEFDGTRCGLCACPVAFKARLETWHCIDGKW
jgi:hypothetical protein